MSARRPLASYPAAVLAAWIERRDYYCVPQELEDIEKELQPSLLARCPSCGNTGWKIFALRYCDCAMGKDLERVEKRRKRA
jgi:hypothetical protein